MHILPRDEYRAVRTARNRYKITQPEQDALYARRIGVLGLSVGNAAAVTFALEGIGGAFKIADFDLLSLSNINRLRSGVSDIGVNKTVLAAREMFEIDPYLEIIRYPLGIDAANIDDFLFGGGRLDLLVEECDDLYLKIVIRERCRDLGIPVIMDTSDRGMLDIERFDREPSRAIMHGLIGEVRAEKLRGIPTKDKVPIFLDIVGGHRMSTRMAASLPEIDQSIGSWPQLASAVALGGAITADAARRLLLGELTQSGRWYVDVESLVRNGSGEFAHGAPPPRPLEIAPEAQRPRVVGQVPPVGGAITHEAVRWIVAHAVLAPSPHNAQPWTFAWRGDRLECRHDPTHDLPSLDFGGCATWATFGAVVENLTIASRAIGLEPDVRLAPSADDRTLVCDVHFTISTPQPTDWLDLIPKRATNRRRDIRRPLANEAATALVNAAAVMGARLQLVTDDERLIEIGRLMGACDRISNMNHAIHREVNEGLRWTRDEVERHRDGLDIATMELTPSERAGMWLLSKWDIVEALKRFGGGLALKDLARKCVDASSAVGLLDDGRHRTRRLLPRGPSAPAHVARGDAVVAGAAAMDGPAYPFARVERGGGVGLSPERSWNSAPCGRGTRDLRRGRQPRRSAAVPARLRRPADGHRPSPAAGARPDVRVADGDRHQSAHLYAGRVLINTALSAALWAKSRDPLHRALVLVWGSTLLGTCCRALWFRRP